MLWAETSNYPTLHKISGKYSSGVNVCFAVQKKGKGHDDNLNHSVSTAFFNHLSDWSYMLPCLSEEEEEVDGDGDGALGKTLSVGVMLGLPKPDELELLERWGPWPCPITGAGRTGLTGGGLKGALGLRTDRAGLKVVIVSDEELLLLRRWAASGSLITMVWRGLADTSCTPPGCLSGSNVSSTTSGACLATFCLSNSRNSCRAVFIVFSISWEA